jgi:FkbH-like protein
MIMLDDSPAECELLRQLVPECHVVNIPEQPYLIPGLVARLPLLENLRLTAEDRSKGKMYRQQAARHGLQASFSDVGEFLRSLDLRVTIDAATSFSIPRIAQLTQKTNQFNVTTRRYSETEIERLASEPATEVFAVSVCDRFGDNGIVGVIILNYESRECHIDTLLLSCRVIGREVETAMVSFLAGRAQHRGASTLVGRFVATPKNAPAADLYSRLGFEKVDESTFRADLETEQFEWPEFIGRADPDAD